VARHGSGGMDLAAAYSWGWWRGGESTGHNLNVPGRIGGQGFDGRRDWTIGSRLPLERFQRVAASRFIARRHLALAGRKDPGAVIRGAGTLRDPLSKAVSRTGWPSLARCREGHGRGPDAASLSAGQSSCWTVRDGHPVAWAGRDRPPVRPVEAGRGLRQAGALRAAPLARPGGARAAAWKRCSRPISAGAVPARVSGRRGAWRPRHGQRTIRRPRCSVCRYAAASPPVRGHGGARAMIGPHSPPVRPRRRGRCTPRARLLKFIGDGRGWRFSRVKGEQDEECEGGQMRAVVEAHPGARPWPFSMRCGRPARGCRRCPSAAALHSRGEMLWGNNRAVTGLISRTSGPPRVSNLVRAGGRGVGRAGGRVGVDLGAAGPPPRHHALVPLGETRAVRAGSAGALHRLHPADA